MAFRSDDQDDRWPRRDDGLGHRPDRQPQRARSDSADSLSLQDTLRELAVTVAGFVGAILLITVALKFLQ